MILGIDIGGTSVKMGLVDESGRVYGLIEYSVSFDGYRTPILTTVMEKTKKYLAQSPCQIEGIGVSATGQIDTQAGAVIGTNGKIPNYEGSQIKAEMESAFSVPVKVLNDANAAALGECHAGAAVGFKHVIMITIGTGVGGGIVTDGKVQVGSRGLAGEIGHFTLYQDGEPCACGKRGCFESYGATTALIKAANEDGINGRIIFERAAQGDKEIQRILDRWIDDIAAGITGLVHIFNPQLVLIGGGVSAQEEWFINPLRQKVLSGVMPRFGEMLLLRSATLGNTAGLIGAAKFYTDN